jgi:hypothetical protein
MRNGVSVQPMPRCYKQDELVDSQLRVVVAEVCGGSRTQRMGNVCHWKSLLEDCN